MSQSDLSASDIRKACSRIGSLVVQPHRTGSHAVHTIYEADDGTIYQLRVTKIHRQYPNRSTFHEQTDHPLDDHPNKHHCVTADAITWYPDEAIFGEVVTLPGECQDCGQEHEYIYDRVGIYDPDTDSYTKRI